MSTKPDSLEERFSSLSKDQIELVRRMLEAETRHAQRIRPCARGNQDPLRLPASWAQHRLWFIDQLEGGSAYNICIAVRLQGSLDCDAFQRSLNAIVERHETLRTSFSSIDGEPLQVIAKRARFSLQVLDWSRYPEAEREERLLQLKSEEVHAKVELASGPLIRGRLARLGEKEHVFLLTMHHIVSDGWSIGVFMRELSQLYAAYEARKVPSLVPLPIQYADYAQWQRQWLQGAVLDKQLGYWRKQLEDASLQLELPTDRPRPAVQSYRGRNAGVVIDSRLTAALKALAQRHDVTLFMVLHAAWAVLLTRLSGHESIVIGTPVANRQRPELEGLIGFFVNTLALRLEVRADLRVGELLKHVREVTLAAYEHQDVPFEKVVEALQPERTLSRHPVFQAMFALQNTPASQPELPKLLATLEDGVDEPSKFDIELLLEERDGQLVGSVNYATDLFDASTIERWKASLIMLLEAMSADPLTRVGRLPLLTEAERRRILEGFNATNVDFPEESLLHELIEERVRLSPDAIAVVHEEQSLSFAEINQRANQLAGYLRERGAGPDRLVAICLERGVELLIGMLGVLKAGAAYVPLDPAAPAGRLEHILEDANPQVLITNESLKSELPETRAIVVSLDGERGEIAKQSGENPSVRLPGLHPRSLAYVIYTSGSTGKPKGVMVEHRNLVNYATHIVRHFDVASGEGSIVATSLSFDLGLTGLYPTLLAGKTVRFCREQHGLPALAEEVLRCTGLSPLKLTPSHLVLLEPALRSGRLKGRVNALVLGGEPLQAQAVQLWKRYAPATRVFNHYGPTETTIGCIVNEVGEPGSGIVPLGKPIANTRIYVLDPYMQPVPVGVTGEIHIAGAGVARGYLNRADLTAERFLEDPFSNVLGERMYRSGDLGRWRADGTVEYLGRNDRQLKIRGYRIEPGEVEAQLVQHELVKEAAVIAREDIPGEMRLVAYITRRDDRNPMPQELMSHLKARVPGYMTPAAFVTLDRLPVSPNGKLDRQALPPPGMDAFTLREFEAPRGEVEEQVASLWRELLRVDRVGRLDNFFELGGFSLQIVQLKERLRRAGFNVSVRSLYESPTLAALAAALDREAASEFVPPPNLIPAGSNTITPLMLPLVDLAPEHIERIARAVPGGAENIQDIYPLAPLQEGILFHHALNADGGDTYVVTLLLAAESRDCLNAFSKALQSVIDRHDALRTALVWEGLPKPVQVVHRRAVLPVDEVPIANGEDALGNLKERMRPDRQRLNVQQAPLMRLQVAADRNSDRVFLLLQLHHLINDHKSLEIILEETARCMGGRVAELSEPVPYRNHVAQAIAQGGTGDHEEFFRTKLGDIDELTAPFGLIDLHGDASRVDEAYLTVNPVLAQRVRAEARRVGVSPAIMFHAAWALVVARASARDDVVFGTVLLGRLLGSADVQRSPGLFVNTLPLRLRLHGVSVRGLVQQTHTELAELLHHEQTPLAVAQGCSGVPASSPLFNALLNYRFGTANIEAGFVVGSGIEVLATQDRTNYPIVLSVDDVGDGFTLAAQTECSIEPRRVTAYLHEAIASLVQALEQAPHTPALALSVLPESERCEVVESFNATHAPVHSEKRVHEIFEEQAARTPHATALSHGGQSLTYRDLDVRASQLARTLTRRGVGPDQLVAIFVERSLEMVVGLVAILKAGGAYLPLDPNYPEERLQYMIEDAAPRVVLTQDSLKHRVPGSSADILVLDTMPLDQGEAAAADVPPLGQGSSNLVYVIYTSGSTGRPKGTAMEHRSMVNLIEWHRQVFGSSSDHRVLQFAALSFDVAFQEIFSTLCTGGTLVLLDEAVRRDPCALAELLNRERIDRLFLPPLMLQSLAEYCQGDLQGRVPASLQDVITAGEQLRVSPEVVAFFRRIPECRLHNHYGPTETHVVTALTLTGDAGTWPSFPSIGRPIANTQIYVLDAERRPVPIGVVGEVYIGGANVARGYLRRPELTAGRFVPDPFSADPHARLYRTGDIGRWQSNGTIDYLGRNDDQVKIRGYRIELGEIEAQLAGHPEVKEAAVIAREDVPGEKRLVAYVTPRGARIDTESLRARVASALPAYMLPSAFVVLDRMPLTPSGKLNRRALPAPQLDSFVSEEHFEPPEGPLENTLVDIWKGVLGVPRVGRDDNFFQLGGHSLSGMRLVAAVRERLDARLSVAAVFQYPTVRQMAVAVESLQPSPDIEEGVI